MIKCPDCNKFGACDKASEDVIECLDFKKQSYDTEIVKVDKKLKEDLKNGNNNF